MPATPIALSQLSKPSIFLATGFGSGLFPVAPGTVGSLAALLIYFSVGTQTLLYLAVIAVAFFAGIWICDAATSIIGTHDHSSIVWDEFVGMWITLIWVPISLKTLVLGFLLFRLFDVLKPFPIGWLDQRIHGGLGIMLDDVLAGVFAWLSLQLILKYFPL